MITWKLVTVAEGGRCHPGFHKSPQNYTGLRSTLGDNNPLLHYCAFTIPALNCFKLAPTKCYITGSSLPYFLLIHHQGQRFRRAAYFHLIANEEFHRKMLYVHFCAKKYIRSVIAPSIKDLLTLLSNFFWIWHLSHFAMNLFKCKQTTSQIIHSLAGNQAVLGPDLCIALFQ